MKYGKIVWGRTPSDWNEVTLGELVQKVNRTYEAGGESPPTVCSISNKKGFNKSEEEFDKQVYSDKLDGYNIVYEGEFAYNPSRINVGSIAQLKNQETALISPMYEVFSVKESQLLPEYFNHLIKSPQMLSLFDAFSEGSVRQTLNFTNFSEIPVVLPPLAQQQAIVNVLDTVSELINKTQQSQNLIRQLNNSLFSDFLSGKHEGLETKPKRLGPVEKEIPKRWNVKKLSEVADIKRGASPRPIDEYMGESVNWVKISDISDGKYVRETEKSLIPEGKQESVFVKAGSVILSISATVAEPAILNIDGCIHDGIVTFQNLNENILPEYLYYSLIEMQSRLEAKGQRAAGNQSNINSSIVKNSKIVVPPLVAQEKIVNSINVLHSRRDGQAQREETLSDLYDSVSMSLVSGGVK